MLQMHTDPDSQWPDQIAFCWFPSVLAQNAAHVPKLAVLLV